MDATRSSPRGAFSLLEVVIAIGVFSTGIVAILAILSTLAREGAQASYARLAANLAPSIATELNRQAALQGFSTFATAVPLQSAAADDGYFFVANGEGVDLRRYDVAETPRRDMFFLIEIRKFGAAPLAYFSGAEYLALNVRISWPYRPLDSNSSGSVVPASARESLNFNMAITK